MDQEIYRSLNAHFGIIRFNQELKITYLNEKAATLSELTSSSDMNFFLEDRRLPSFISAKPKEFYQQVLDGKDVWESVPVTSSNQSTLQVHFLPMVSEGHHEKRGLITIKRVPATNSDSRTDAAQLSQKYVDYSPTYYSVVDTEGNVYFHGEKGHKPNEKQHLKDILPESHLELYLGNIQEASAKNKVLTSELNDPDNLSKSLLLHHFPIISQPNKPLVGIITTDVSEIQQRERHIGQINQLLEKLIELSEQLFSHQDDFIQAIDLRGILEILCKISSAESGLLFRKENKKEVFQLISQYDRENAQNSLSRALRNHDQGHLEWVKDQLQDQRVFLVNDLSEMPAESANERELLMSAGVSSLLVTNISLNEETTGYLCLANLQDNPEDLGEIIKTIEIASGQVGLFFNNFQITRQLEKSLQEYHFLAKNISDVVSIQSLSGRCLFVSPSVEKMYGYPPDNFIGRIVEFNIHPDDLEMYKQTCSNLEKDDVRVFRYRRRHKSGRYLWVESSGRLVREKQGDFILLVTRDISMQKKAEDDLKRREEYFNSLIRSQSNYLIRTDMEGYFTYANPAFLEKFSFFGEIIGMPSMNTIVPDDHEKTLRMIEECISVPGKMVPIQLRKAAEDGGYYTNYWEFVAISDDQGNPTEIQGVGYDITEKQNALQNIEKSEAFMKSLINNNSNPIWAVDEEDRLLYVNEAFLSYTRSLGLSFKVGDRIFDELPEVEQKLWKNYYERARQEGNFKDQQKFNYNGRDYYFDIYFSPILNEKGENIGHSVFAANISDLKETEFELLSAKASLEEAIKTRSTFLSMITHELRTPLNAILGMSGLMQATKLNEEQEKYIETLSYSSRMLNSLINDVLDYTSMRAGEFKMEKMNFKLREVLDQTVKLYQHKALEKDIKLSYYLDKSLPENINGDAVRLGQIFNNLVENALKFTEAGEISIKVKRGNHKKKTNQLLIQVSDTGMGIPKDKQKEIFEPFRQANSEVSRYQGGRGLGLAIVTLLVNHNGGSIDVESTPGQGTTFTLHYFYNTADEQQKNRDKASLSQEQWFARLNILYIEDMTINQTLMKGLFQNWGSHLDVASDGYQGIEMVQQKEYDLILMDLLMPELDGYETAQQIRTLKRNESDKIPIIAVSAFQGKEIERRIQEAGINDYILKPIDFQKLKSVILQHTWGGKENKKNIGEAKGTYLSRLEKLAFKDKEQYVHFLIKLKNEFADSRQKLEEAVNKGDNEAISFVRHHNLALLSMFSGEHEQLINRLSKLKEAGPKDPEAVELLHKINQELRMLEKSIDERLAQQDGE